MIDLLQHLQAIGVNHVAFNLKYGERPAWEVLEEVEHEVLPAFPNTECTAKGAMWVRS